MSAPLPSPDGWRLFLIYREPEIESRRMDLVASYWPPIKRIRGDSGDEICRNDDEIFVNIGPVAHAFPRTKSGADLSKWSGRRVLGRDEFLLLNDHERSLDGRYFGATKVLRNRRDSAS